MGDEERVRIRRLPDGRKWSGRSARYEIEFRGVEDDVERVVTMTPGAELRRLTGMRHPADLATFTNAADLAWDGGTGPWRGWPGVDIEQDPAPSGPPGEADPQDVRRRAQEYVDRRVGGALLGPGVLMDDTYFLSSLDSTRFEPVRTFKVHRVVAFDTGKPALLGDLVPGVVGQDFGRGESISRVVVTSRHEGVDVDHIESFPCFVLIALPPVGSEDLQTPLRADQLEVIGWGELYRTAADAADHEFD